MRGHSTLTCDLFQVDRGRVWPQASAMVGQKRGWEVVSDEGHRERPLETSKVEGRGAHLGENSRVRCTVGNSGAYSSESIRAQPGSISHLDPAAKSRHAETGPCVQGNLPLAGSPPGRKCKCSDPGAGGDSDVFRTKLAKSENGNACAILSSDLVSAARKTCSQDYCWIVLFTVEVAGITHPPSGQWTVLF